MSEGGKAAWPDGYELQLDPKFASYHR